MEIYIPCIFVMLIVFFSRYWCAYKSNKCNGKYIKADDEQIQKPEFKVIKIEEKFSEGYSKNIAEYTIESFYKKDISLVGHIKLVVYGEVGEYQIGDVLIFGKK